MTITERVFDLLSKQHKTDASLCGHLGIKSNVIANWKKTNTIPPAKYLVSISEFLGVSCDYLLTGKESTSSLSFEEEFILDTYRNVTNEGKEFLFSSAKMVRNEYKKDIDISSTETA